MLDKTTKMQRVRGEAMVRITRAGLADLRQKGSAKAMLPRTDEAEPEVVFLNTSGGVTGGDLLTYDLIVGAGARATGATQTAERAYRATAGEPGRITTRLQVGTNGRLDWLPQEVILFEGSHMARTTEVELSRNATFLGVESIVLGRAAHGEEVRRAHLDDVRTIRRDGQLVHQEHLSLTPDVLTHGASLGGARAIATLTFLTQGVEDAAAPLREVLGADGQVSAWDGRLVARLMAPAAAPLRRALIRAIVCLRGRPIPRVWQSDV